jgi:hypothetical protein
MRRKIVFLLSLLFLLFSLGAVAAILYIRNTTEELSQLVTLHRVENLRRALIISVQSVQADLYTIDTPLGHKLDSIVEDVSRLEDSIEKCRSCHHPQNLARQIGEVRSLVDDYKHALSRYITASADLRRMDQLKLKAASFGNDILSRTEGMSFRASTKLTNMTRGVMLKII